MRKKQIAIFILKIIIISTLVGIAVWWFFFHPYVTSDDARVAMRLTRMAPAGQGGRIVKVFIDEGDRVLKGQTLLELDHRPAQAALARTEARFELAREELKRVQQLYREKSVPSRDLDRAVAEFQTVQAEVKLAELALENTYLKSPLSGVVVQRLAEVGNMLDVAQVAITVADVDNAWISANVEETYVGLLKKGQEVAIKVDEGRKLEGTLDEIRLATASQFALIPTENTAGNYTKLVQRIPIKIKLKERPTPSLRAGQSVSISIRVNEL